MPKPKRTSKAASRRERILLMVVTAEAIKAVRREMDRLEAFLPIPRKEGK